MKKNNINHQKGISLIEVLVSLLVFGIGILGFISLQLNALQYTQDSELKTFATWRINELVENMRSNIKGFEDGFYKYEVIADNSGSSSNPNLVNCNNNSIKDCITNECSTEEQAKYDLKSFICGNGSNDVNGIKDRLIDYNLTISCQPKDPPTEQCNLNKPAAIKLEWLARKQEGSTNSNSNTNYKDEVYHIFNI
ncbi:type IV pilus modification protein PilV [Endozoicomonas sp. SM1973]|uniref:Type IV pilus modification protein PilV n=1 Tax=Spartinivicinus marinus TaxID=2994442 RepID=A0A853IB08_9GAMM|nr:type IV pilus modification protein PilV [Spartinivicinus marinus]MCX4026772.1 type IV pilus modification protein PilV [Spartinivicinus marinus]NYZ64606.1 type IV pilus modification protein PilV [Spartinivicinus marinus]